MKSTNRILLTIGCLALLIVSWVIVLGAKSNSEKQADLMAQASEYMADEVYILAVPLLEEAAGYNTKKTPEAEAELKKAYLELLDQRGFRGKYMDLLEKQMNRKNAAPEIFAEAASFYLASSRLEEALPVLKNGIKKTGSEKLIAMYESNRYAYQMGYTVYDDVTAIYGRSIGVEKDGLWGVAKSDGALQIPCEYEKISTYSTDRVIVQKGAEIFAVDSDNNRLARLNEKAIDFGNYAEELVPLLTKDGWKRATGKFEMGTVVFEQIGTYSNGYAAAKQNGKWGVIDMASDWLVPPEHDGIAMDELGCSYAQDAVFVKNGQTFDLYAEGVKTGESYDDAKPFSSEGFAAVKKNGKWGFVDTAGELKISYKYADALSFGQHLAAIKQDELWGYISLSGELVIEPIFLQAKSFADGSAPVLTERGWQFITLTEYKKGMTL